MAPFNFIIIIFLKLNKKKNENTPFRWLVNQRSNRAVISCALSSAQQNKFSAASVVQILKAFIATTFCLFLIKQPD